MSPLPFGVQCVPDRRDTGTLDGVPVSSPLPFGVQCVPDPGIPPGGGLVGIVSPLPFGVQCVPDSEERKTKLSELRLHCLSAFSAFPTFGVGLRGFETKLSPLPFGVQCVPDLKRLWIL